MNDRLVKLRIALDQCGPERVRQIARSALDAWADIDRLKVSGGGYEAGFWSHQSPGKPVWVVEKRGSRDYCVAWAEARQHEGWRARAESGFEVWPVWGRGLEG